MPEISPLFYPLLFAVAFLYAAVGHGGASGYLALMALFSFSPALMKPSALILNIFVSGIAFWQYFRKVGMRWRLFFALAGLAVPAAFIGGTITLDQGIYKQILGLFLIVPILRFAGLFPQESGEQRKPNVGAALFIGAAIGFLSGLLGIGGGIILSPVVLMLAWANMKETAAISALFILVNSAAGLLGSVTTGLVISLEILYLVVVAIAGGMLGAYLGANYFSGLYLKRILALVLVVASAKLMLT